MEGNTPTLQVRPIIRGPDDFWAAYTGAPAEAAVGLIRGLPELIVEGPHLNRPFTVTQALDILIKIGWEPDAFEPDPNLRAGARLVLARHFLAGWASRARWDCAQREVESLVRFFAHHPVHSRVPERDAQTIFKFLKACQSRDTPPASLLDAIFQTGNYQLLPISSLPDLYAFLVAVCPQFPALKWKGWPTWPNRIEGHVSATV